MKFICILLFASYITTFAEDEGIQVRFIDVTTSSGINFRHIHGGTGKKYFVETMGAGCAALDYDNDGWLDIFAVNGGPLPGYIGERPLNALYRNEGDGRFRDVTEHAGVGVTDYGMGCCVGDYDNDGFDDLLVTAYGRNSLFHNEGDGTFSEVSESVGIHSRLQKGETPWNTGCAFFDYDRDGYLDLFIAGYLAYELSDAERDLTPYAASIAEMAPSERPEERSYPHPINFPGLRDILYRNNGDGTLSVLDPGLGRHTGKGLGAVALDFDEDGDSDLFVGNDMTPNFLFRNDGSGGDRDWTFEEVGLYSGVGYNEVGGAQASMGVDAGDYDGDGLPDLVVTNFQDEGVSLYRNEGGTFFSDISMPSGVRGPSLKRLGWGVSFVDCDNDGWSDLLSVNGHVLDNIDLFDPGASYRQRRLLLRNMGMGRFEDISDQAGSGFEPAVVGRGAAFGDFDNDGDVDVFINNNNSPATLLRNEGGNRNHWLMVKLVGGRGKKSRETPDVKRETGKAVAVAAAGKAKGSEVRDQGDPASRPRLSNRNGIGARVTVWADGRQQVKEVRSGSSYMSQNDFRVHFGLGSAGMADSVRVRWPSGLVSRIGKVHSNRIMVVREGGSEEELQNEK